jgi:predicted nucleic acid-binding Zn ribbon protein
VCGAPAQRVLHPVAIHFKGSGFYSTDYGRKSKAASEGKSDGKSESSSDSKSSEKSDSKGSGGSGEPKKAAEA